jgi:hypothetical protein
LGAMGSAVCGPHPPGQRGQATQATDPHQAGDTMSSDAPAKSAQHRVDAGRAP